MNFHSPQDFAPSVQNAAQLCIMCIRLKMQLKTRTQPQLWHAQ